MVRKSEGLWEALGLVDHNRTGVRVEEAFKIGSQQGEVGRPFKIKAGPVWERVACKSAFSALPRSHKEHGGKRPEKGVKTLSMLSGNVSHTLDFCIEGSKLQGIV